LGSNAFFINSVLIHLPHELEAQQGSRSFNQIVGRDQIVSILAAYAPLVLQGDVKFGRDMKKLG
jgi:hypothetical protein